MGWNFMGRNLTLPDDDAICHLAAMPPLPAQRIIAGLVACFAVSLFQVRAAGSTEPVVVDLWPEGVPGLLPDAGPEQDVGGGKFVGIHHPSLTVYAPAKAGSTDTAVILCSGGGYQRVAIGERGGPLTQWLNAKGVTVFVLKYRTKEYGHPAPLRDVLRAVRTVRARAGEFGVAPNHIGVMGGSAGGHLTACAGTLYDAPEGRTGTGIDAVSARPDFMVLLFPVITMLEPHVHAPSRRNLLGDAPSDELKRHLSVELQATKDTPPTFLVHSAEDHTVSVENSLLFYQAMVRAGASVEMHLYPKGPHGSGLSPELGPTSEWPRLCESWMRFNGWLPK
jgi:acetyl esterase/lipase